ncbi:hypothetical protein Bra3105_01500 [Brachybacterium halotolerans subsp. kimchii]|uniref:Uncharacterized protein n=2 Tax=Brachybacterium TaxID=43668 RepID=A0ABS1B6D8_9MICO|nr:MULTISPECIES: hypothetical protein [Brachybacterium]MBK0330211.1 hypothetical protein [Brachybacterium halotolerans]MCG7309186.1 hypothetical protein [Brachybacterium sp. ACRRE]UEJ83034.1 hypothetical protein Bra3105_01500 [Brachybacterium halotolerans subsp. kimchii]UQN30358.1 hypothetical protein M4486_03160 [Brachybacterium kimchii]
MLDHVLILAEGGSHASEGGVPPILVGGAMFLGLLILLGITYLFSGQNQRPAKTRTGARAHTAQESASTDARRH